MLRPLVDGVEGPAFAPQVFHEAMHDDARTNLAIALTAAERGAAGARARALAHLEGPTEATNEASGCHV